MNRGKNKNRHKAPEAASLDKQPLTSLGVKITERAMPLMVAEIRTWRAAVAAARDPLRPRRTQLVLLCESAEVDGHLSSAMEKRRMRVSGMTWRLVDVKGQEVPEAKKLLEKAAFQDLLAHLAEVPVKGPACIMLAPSRGGFPVVTLIPRTHYVPEALGVLLDLGDETPFFLGGDEHKPFFVHAIQRGANSLGILWKAVPQVVFKRSAQVAWGEYGEIFGQPIRVAKTPPMEVQKLAELDRKLADMGRAAYIRVPYGVDLQLLASSGQGAHLVFDAHMGRANSEMSKLVEGQTMTSDDGASKSQSEVHEKTAQLYRYEDSAWVAACMNDQVIPALIQHGIKLDGLRFEFVEQDEVAPEISLATDQWLQQEFDVPADYFAAKYGVPLKAKAKALPGAAPTGPAPTPWQPQQHLAACPGCGGHQGPQMTAALEEDTLDKLRAALARLARKLFDQEASVVDWDLMKVAAAALEAAVAEGLDVDKLTWESPDLLASAVLRSNAWKFAGGRTVAETRAIRAELTGADGTPREWPAFRKAALDLHGEYYELWLKSEYNAARMAAIAARQWVDIQQDAEEFPYLEYQTVGDARVRKAHGALDGLTRKVDDPIWSKVYPPNGWNCRCDVRQCMPDAVATPDGEVQSAATAVAEDWEFNPGKELRFWPNAHPYLVDMQERPFSDFGFAASSGLRRKAKTPAPLGEEAWAELKAKGTVTGNIGGLPFSLPDALAADSVAARQLITLAATPPHERWAQPVADGVAVRHIWFLDDLLHRLDILITDEGSTVAAFVQDSDTVMDNKRKGTPWPMS